MSKKTPKAELIERRVAIEREWCYARWMERMTYRQIKALAPLPVEAGGLGVHLSHEAVRSMVAEYRAARGDVTMSRDERLERQSDEVDEMMRQLRREIADFVTQWGVVPEKAAKMLLDYGKREAELHGLNAATKIEADVTVTDAATVELNAMLAEAGLPPIEVTS